MKLKIPFTNFALDVQRNEPRGLLAKDGVLLSQLITSEGVRIAPKDLWQIYRMNADVYSCIREWKQGVGAGGYRYLDKRDLEVEAPAVEVAFIDLFFRNSGGLSVVTRNIIRDLGICGNAYLEIVKAASGKPYGLKRLDPRSMYVVADKHGTVLRYLQKVHGSDTVEFLPENMVHIVLDEDPDNELLGMSPLETALWEARTDISAAQSNYYFFENDAVPSNVYVLDEKIPKTEVQAAFDKIKADLSGAKNRNKAAVLSGVKEIKTISMSQKDMEFVVGRKFNTDKVCSVYGVPKFMLGYTENVNYSNSISLRADFYAGTITPLELILQQAFTENLFPKIGIFFTVMQYNPQQFGEELEGSRFALTEFQLGALTLRQYKIKTKQPISQEDEDEPLIDKHILQNGSSAILMEDVGVDPIIDPNDPEMAENMVKALKNKFSNETDQ